MSKETRRDKYTGSCFYLPKEKRWKAQFRWTDSDGNKHTKIFTNKSENYVRSKMEEFARLLQANPTNPMVVNPTFKEYVLHWLYDVEKPKLKPISFERKLCTVNKQLIPFFGEYNIEKINLTMVQSMVNKLYESGLSVSTIKKAVECLNCCIRYFMAETGINRVNPCSSVVLPRNNPKVIRVFSDDECKKIETEALRTYGNGAFIYRFGPGIILLLYSGMRIGEALALNWSDIDFQNRKIRICKNVSYVRVSDVPGEKYDYIIQNETKTKSGNRIIPMTQKAYDMLKLIHGYTGHQSKVFITSSGNRVQEAYFNRCFHKILNNCNITDEDETEGVHSLRHTFATRLFSSGCDVKTVSAILGHSTVRITYDIYISAIQEMAAKAMTNIDQYFGD